MGNLRNDAKSGMRNIMDESKRLFFGAERIILADDDG